ncbi:septal ring lytic transglycosylase RlpA family protein [Paraburkholderia sp. DHOC27]|uniref:septal ring lytic transglycosylase RlpA family protein n=1 Tax=Paraburkholderia sp. DHOC27 TaxID=2303330 RepID=UPI00286F797C|nr:septal ring lytic transglycosylase RlpA family protein [Paraburkholderia sp. DHOC27]
MQDVARTEVIATSPSSPETDGAGWAPESSVDPASQAKGSAGRNGHAPKAHFWQSGVASWYGKAFQGRRTANGERYDAHALTAAHRTLPMGSYVRVTAVGSTRSVVVRINDRGPFARGRVIDLSYAAAAALNLQRTGTMLVNIESVGQDAEGS